MQVNASSSNLRSLSPVARRPAESAPAPEALDCRGECSFQESGVRWGKIGLASLGVLASGIGVVHAQMQAPQPRVDVQDPLIVAHRGSTEHSVENTMDAFREALANGANALELDVHLTSDGDLAVIHDDTLDRTFGRPGVVRQMTSEELRAAGVPMLSDVLTLPDCQLIIEIKHPKGGRHIGIEQILIDQLEGAGAEGRSVVVSFDETSLKKLHQLEPELDTGYLYGGRELDPQQAKDELGITYLGPHYGLVTDDYVAKAHQAGLKVNPWTVNESKDMERMIGLDCDAITTDRAGNLVQLLND